MQSPHAEAGCTAIRNREDLATNNHLCELFQMPAEGEMFLMNETIYIKWI